MQEEIPRDLVMTVQTWEKWILRGKTDCLIIEDSEAKVLREPGIVGQLSVEHSPLMNWLKRVVDEALEREALDRKNHTA